MVLTVLEAHVPTDRAHSLDEAYRSLRVRPTPPGLVSSQLVRSVSDSTLWRIETLWRDRAALEAMRTQGTPAGVQLFRDAGIEPALAVFEVVAAISSDDRDIVPGS